jgi:hypothetical protein
MIIRPVYPTDFVSLTRTILSKRVSIVELAQMQHGSLATVHENVYVRDLHNTLITCRTDVTDASQPSTTTVYPYTAATQPALTPTAATMVVNATPATDGKSSRSLNRPQMYTP